MADPVLRIAVVGRVNAGKSSFVNALVREERMIVSEIPGTTRDSVDVRFEKDGEAFVVIDTAGIRKERSVQNSVDFYAQRRAERAIRRADVTALVLDATAEIARLDREIAGSAIDGSHPVVFVVNKWDLAPKALKSAAFVKYLATRIPGLAFAPVVFTSALDGTNVARVIEVARSLHDQAGTRVSTADLNRTLERAYAMKKPKPVKSKVGRIFFGTQVDVHPPTFVLFVDDPARFPDAYRRFLENRFRELLPFAEVPFRLRLKARVRGASKNLLGPKPE